MKNQKFEIAVAGYDYRFKTYARDGVEASSFTDLALESAAAIEEKADRADMILNRPFLFGIKDRGVWLLIGVCDHPAA